MFKVKIFNTGAYRDSEELSDNVYSLDLDKDYCEDEEDDDEDDYWD